MQASGTFSKELSSPESNRWGKNSPPSSECSHSLSWGGGWAMVGSVLPQPGRVLRFITMVTASAASSPLSSHSPASLLAIAMNSKQVRVKGHCTLCPLPAVLSPKYGSFLIIQNSDLCMGGIPGPPWHSSPPLLFDLFYFVCPNFYYFGYFGV